MTRSMTRSIPLSLSTLALLAAVAVASPDEGYDLRARYSAKKGDNVRIVEKAKSQINYVISGPDGEELQKQEGTDGRELRYDEEVHELDASGKETASATRRYAGIVDYASGESLDLSAAPIAVKMTRSPEGEVRFEPADPAQADKIPPLLQNLMDMESGPRPPSTEDEVVKQMFPEKKVKAGESWPIAVDAVASVFGMGDPEAAPTTGTDGPAPPPPAPGSETKPAAIDAEKSSATGTLEGVEVVDGVNLLKVKIVVKLVLRRFQGMETKVPVAFEGTMTFKLSEGGTSPVGEATMQATIKGTTLPPADSGLPPGATLALDMVQSNTKTVTKVAPPK